MRYIGAVSAQDKWTFLVGLREALNNIVAALLIVSLDAVVVSSTLVRKAFAAAGASPRTA